MREFFVSDLMLLAVTIAVYLIFKMMYDRFKTTIFNPMLISILFMVGYLKLFDVNYEVYMNATKVIDLMLGLSVVSLGYLLYKQRLFLGQNVITILVSIFVGSAIGLISVDYIARLLGAGGSIVMSLQPKSVTTPIAVILSKNGGGIPALTAIMVILVGLFGNMISPIVFKIFGIKSALSRGLALGTSAHGMGTAKAVEMGAVEGAMSALAIGIAGAMTAVMIPIFNQLMS